MIENDAGIVHRQPDTKLRLIEPKLPQAAGALIDAMQFGDDCGGMSTGCPPLPPILRHHRAVRMPISLRQRVASSVSRRTSG